MTRGLGSLLALLVALTANAPTHAQDRSTPDTLVTLMAEAQAAYSNSSLDEAGAKFQAVVDLAHENHNDLWEARGLSGLGSVAAVRGKYEQARGFLLQALESFARLDSASDLSRVEKQLGDLAYLTHDPKTAAERYEKAAADAIRAGDEVGRIHAALSLIRLHDDEGLPTALDAIAQLDEDAKKLHRPSVDAPILHSWSDMLFQRGLYEDAIEKLDQAAAIYESIGQRDELSTAYNSLGRIFRVHGQPNAALQAQLKALHIQEELDAPYGHVQSLNAVSVVYQALGDLTKAREYSERALALAEKVGLKAAFPTLHANLGNILIDAGDVVRGRAMVEAAIADDIGSRKSLRYAEVAEADLKLGHTEEALAGAERSMAVCESGERSACVHARLLRADVELAQGNIAAALADQRAAVDEIERVQSTLAASDFLKQGFAAMWARSYSVAVDLEARQGDWRGALETAERARARAFVDLMASRNGAAHKPEPSGELIWRGLRPETPIALRSDATAAPSTLADLSAVAARQHTTLLEYWLGEAALYAWVVDARGAVHGARVPVSRAKVERWVRTAGSPAIAAERAAAWKALYGALIQPIEKHLPSAVGARLTIVPHGPLMQLPFAALRDPQGRYLVERFTLSSVPSVALLRYTGNGRDDARRGAVLLVADPAAAPKITGEPRLPRLPGALEETRAIAQLVPASRTTILAEANATEPRVLAAAAHKAVVHFATHAIVRDADPWSSFLALGVPGDGAADGKLTAKKIYGLSLDANLVVLSACRSGGGLITGDGIANLARAFFYAGASSMIVSVWDVADEPAKRLLPAFYRAWFAGADKAAALRAAQLALLQDLRAGRVTVATPAGDVALLEDPALWAGFVLLGDPD